MKLAVSLVLLAAPASGWGSSWLRDGLVSVWRWTETESRRPRCVLFLSGVAGWAGEGFSLEPREGGAVAVVGERATVLLSCPAEGRATLAGHPAALESKAVWLLHGIGAVDRGVSVRPLAVLEGSFARDADVGTALYDASSDLRAAIHYTR